MNKTNVQDFSPYRAFTYSLLVFIGLVGIFAFVPTRPAQGAPVVAVVVVAVTAVGVVDYVSCDFDIVFIDDCKGKKKKGSGGEGNNDEDEDDEEDEDDDDNDRGNRWRWWGGGNDGENGGSSSSQACSSTQANACGMFGTGFIVGGVCNAVTPPNSQCPAPVIGKNFYAEPDRVRSGNSATLHWGSIVNATTCNLLGGGLSLSDIGLAGNQVTNPITAQTAFTLTCENGPGGPVISSQTTVGLIPSFEEI